MRHQLAKTIAAMLLLTVTIASGAQADQNAFAGTWKLNLAKSHLDPATEPQEETVTVAAGGATQIEGTSHG